MKECNKHTYRFISEMMYYNKAGKGKVKSEFKCEVCGKKKLMTEAQMRAAAKLTEKSTRERAREHRTNEYKERHWKAVQENRREMGF